MLPAKRKRQRSGIERAPQRIWPRHRKFVRQFACSVPLCQYGSPIEFAHYRTAGNSGTGQRPHDMFGLSLCRSHHREQHQIGQAAFEKKYGFSMAQTAAEFARKTTDKAMLASLALVTLVGECGCYERGDGITVYCPKHGGYFAASPRNL